MQFYSDYSSEDDGDDGRDFWNPNDLIDTIQNTAEDQTKSKLKKDLISKFLEQQRPMLTSKMREFLVEDEIIETLMGFVSRLDEPEMKKEENKTRVRPLNPSNNEEAVRKSFNVMEVFLNPMNDLDALLHEKLVPLLRELFKVFQNNSAGNFHHFNKIMEQLLVRSPVEVTQTLISENLLWVMLDFLHESPVVDSMIDIFCCGFPRQSDTIQFYKQLVDAKVFEKIGEKLFSKANSSAAFVADFFIRLLEKLSSFEMSGILFISLCRSSTFIDGLFKIATCLDDTFPPSQKQATALVLRELLIKSGEKIYEQADFSRPLPNMLSAVHDKLHEHSKVHVVALCEALIGLDAQKKENTIPFSAYVIKRAFGLYRFALVEILTDLIICTPEILEQVPQQTWRVLGSWFVEYSHNNLYHSMFYKIIQIVVRENNVNSQKHLLNKYKFLSRVIEHYKGTEPTDARGFILLICNTLRLGADLQPPSGWLRHYLLSHDPWKQFLPTLRHDTQMQLKRYQDITSDMLEDDDADAEEDLDIDLGSAYARSLGFEEEAPAEEEAPRTPKKNKKKKKKGKKKKDGEDSSKESSSDGSSDEKDEKDECTTHAHMAPAVTEDDPSDPSLSQESWWAELKTEFTEAEELKKKDDTSAESVDWWADMKKELENVETNKQ